ncbi:hypothetical protein PAXRUDRAFT_372617 [Paxillus rubicundulus Ve08.2h10]|uniref:Uncharacterized protein n=1 Tax=Paxillus rubicundulus Ve08.2h10 TaxID=930991 RepID=A0A0D0E9A5_9AGAM|nr:hypothetical protein PAXRUDRAFT_372617 [Paxillus rubicundulus Ve08.2h10]
MHVCDRHQNKITVSPAPLANKIYHNFRGSHGFILNEARSALKYISACPRLFCLFCDPGGGALVVIGLGPFLFVATFGGRVFAVEKIAPMRPNYSTCLNRPTSIFFSAAKTVQKRSFSLVVAASGLRLPTFANAG